MTATATSATRRKRADLKRLVLEAGIEVLERDGLGLGAEGVTYAMVFEHLEQTAGIRVTRGSVHERIWDSQRDFQSEILTSVVGSDLSALLADSHALVDATLQQADHSTHAARGDALRHLIRVISRQHLDQTNTPNRLALWRATVQSVLSRPSGDDDVASLRQVATASYRSYVAAQTQLYVDAAQTLGYRIRRVPGLTETQVVEKWTSTMLALAAGFSIRDGAGLIETFDVPSGRDGSLEQWDDFSFAVWQVMSSFLENPPD